MSSFEIIAAPTEDHNENIEVILLWILDKDTSILGEVDKTLRYAYGMWESYGYRVTVWTMCQTPLWTEMQHFFASTSNARRKSNDTIHKTLSNILTLAMRQLSLLSLTHTQLPPIPTLRAAPHPNPYIETMSAIAASLHAGIAAPTARKTTQVRDESRRDETRRNLSFDVKRIAFAPASRDRARRPRTRAFRCTRGPRCAAAALAAATARVALSTAAAMEPSG
jgi:hypothetical protein